MTKYSLTKGPAADNTFSISKDLSATEIEVTKQPGAAGGTARLIKNPGAADGKVRITKGHGGAAVSCTPGSGGCAATFDGASYISASTNLFDNNTGLFSCWFKITDASTNGTNMDILNNPSERLYVRRNASNKFVIRGRTSSDVLVFRAISNSTFTADSLWHHLICSWDVRLTVGTGVSLYIDGVQDESTINETLTANIVDAANTTDFIGTDATTTNFWKGSLSELWLDTTTIFDVATPANLAKFISGGLPVDLGSDGSTPTGSPPAYYLNRAGDDFALNQGSGTDLTVTGALGTENGPG